MSLGLDRFVPREDLLRPIHQSVGICAPLFGRKLREPLLEGLVTQTSVLPNPLTSTLTLNGVPGTTGVAVAR
jgi:hypothetical protein